MNISVLFNELENNEFDGTLSLEGNCIIWTYDLNEESELIEVPDNVDDNEEFSVEITSTAELLQEAYDKNIELIEGLIDEIDDYTNWAFSSPEITETTISFKIF